MEYNKSVIAEEAVKIIKPGNRVFIHGSAATPIHILEALQKRHAELRDVGLVSITTLGKVNFNDPIYKKSFFINSLFVSENNRAVVNSDHGDMCPYSSARYSNYL